VYDRELAWPVRCVSWVVEDVGGEKLGRLGLIGDLRKLEKVKKLIHKVMRKVMRKVNEIEKPESRTQEATPLSMPICSASQIA
jgi:hypothetical protein